MKKPIISHAMILAAGMGTRMMPLTKNQPKAMVTVNGLPLVGHGLAHLRQAGVQKIIVNAWYKKAPLLAWLAGQRDVQVVEEHDLLETGGGIRHALPHVSPDGQPFYAINCDSLWLDGVTPALQRLYNAWDDAAMDALLLLHPTVRVPNYDGYGDFMLTSDGRLLPRPEQVLSPYVYTGIQLLHPRLLDDCPPGAFPLIRAYRKAMERERLFGLVHDGAWFHVSTPADVTATEFTLREMI